MKSYDRVLTHWTPQVKELFPSLHSYQQKSLAFCVQGVVLSGNAVMQKVAEAIREYTESETKMVSHERRMQRFVANEKINVDACWKEFLEQVMTFWQRRTVTLVLDMSPYTKEFTIVYLGMLVHSRMVPVGWCLMPQQESWDREQWEIVGQLFAQVSSHLRSSDCTLLADRGLSCLYLMELCQKQGWHYVLRIKQKEWFRRKLYRSYRDWQQGGQIAKKAGDQWYGEVLLWKEHETATWLSICWEPGYEEPWILVSDRKASRQRVNEYAKRMKVEATFQDQKSRGCCIECSRFTNREHLHRWLFVVFLSLWWVAHLGCSCIHHGHRDQVDRKDRRDKGLLRIGRLWFKTILKKVERDLGPQAPGRLTAQLMHCLPFCRRRGRLYFSFSLS
jgi:Transposase DDE domain